MVAAALDGFSPAWQAMVRQSFKLYIVLALCSLLLTGLWQQLRFPTTSPQGFGIHFYQHALGSLDGRSCPSYPVCSLYARQALQQHGWLLGSWLMIDRLIHEADDLHVKQSMHMIEGEWRLYDPLKRNDFWLHVIDY